jgi:hypothetical protein
MTMTTPSQGDLLIYHHLPKSGGTSLRAVVKENYGPGEVVELYSQVAKLHSKSAASGTTADEAGWYRAWYESLTRDELERLRCVSSHTANQLMPVLDRPFRAFCMLRDPVEHVWSLYHYVLELAERGEKQGRGALSGRELKRLGWSLTDVYRELGGGGPGHSTVHDRLGGFFNGQARSILAPWIKQSQLEYWRGPTKGASRMRNRALEILSRHYVVGVHERYDRSLENFAAAFGWRHVDAPHLNRSSERARPDAQTRAAILAHNQIDDELHARFAAELARP